MEAAGGRRAGIPFVRPRSYAATGRPHASQNRLPGTSAAPHRPQAREVGKRRPQLEQKTASVSGRGPQVEQAGTEASDGVEAEAERSERTLAAIMASRPSDAGSACSFLRASSAMAVYSALRKS